MAVEALFTCTQVVTHASQGRTRDMKGREVPLQQHDVTFEAYVSDAHPYEDNADWSVWTPNGTVNMTVMNADAATYFVPGETYRLVFTKHRPQQARQ